MGVPVSIQRPDGSKTLDLLDSAPASDTGQVALPVRVVSQLGAGTGGGATGGLTNTELRASAVPVSGPLTDTQLRAVPVPILGSVGVNNFPATQAVSAAALPLPAGASTETTLAGVKAGTDRLPAALSSAPASDTGQAALPVRVISQLGAGGGASGGLTNTELRASPLPVSGTVSVGNFPATQPVSGTVGVNNFPATQPVSGTVGINNFPASQPVTGTFWQATQPVSVAGQVLEKAADLAVSVTGAAAAAVTATLPAAGAGLFHYISRINIIAYAAAARTGVAAPVVVTSTNLPGGLGWTTPTAAAIGTQYETDIQLTSPLKSSAANTATTIVGPATASVIWRINVIYYTGA